MAAKCQKAKSASIHRALALPGYKAERISRTPMPSPVRVMNASGLARAEISTPLARLFRRPSARPIKRSAAAAAGNGRMKIVNS